MADKPTRARRSAEKKPAALRKTEKSARSLQWTRLDNAAKIFPPTSHGADTGCFRLSCTLREPVDSEILQQALEKTLLYFPHFNMVMRRGIFWHYLEQNDVRPRVVAEHAPPCAPLYEDSKSALFEVSYWARKINLGVFHVLADGAGGIAFFQALVTYYLTLRHPEEGEFEMPSAPVASKTADAFQKYYRPRSRKSQGKGQRAYHLRGLKRPDHGLCILEGLCDVHRALDAAHRYHATLTVFLCAVLMQAIHGDMYVRHEKRPIVLTVPVDLRSYFPSDTSRNFFGTIRVSYDFSRRSGELADIIEALDEEFHRELTPERLAARMNQMASLEHNPVLRVIPLALKNPVLRLSGDISDMGETAALSNVGKFRLPVILHPYVEGFSAFMSTSSLQLCTCTFGDTLSFGFTSALAAPETQRRFFEILTAEGLDFTIRSNEFFKEES